MLKIKHIVFRDNIRFPDNGILDFKIKGHPTINITEEIEGEIFFLRMSSKIAEYIQNKNKMELIKPSKLNGLSKPSVVKVDHIIKEEYRNKCPAGSLSDIDFERVINKLINFRADNCCDSLYCACADYDSLNETELSGA